MSRRITLIIFSTIIVIVLSFTFYYLFIMNVTTDVVPRGDNEENMESDQLLTSSPSRQEFKITSEAFSDNETIPVKFAKQGVEGGQNISIPVSWSNEPEGTRSLFLVIVDTHPVANNWIHWAVKNIKPGTYQITEGASQSSKMPIGAMELESSYGTNGYGGPQPPIGSGNHPYEIHLFALSVDNIDISKKPSWEQIETTLKPITIQRAQYTGYFGR